MDKEKVILVSKVLGQMLIDDISLVQTKEVSFKPDELISCVLNSFSSVLAHFISAAIKEKYHIKVIEKFDNSLRKKIEHIMENKE